MRDLGIHLSGGGKKYEGMVQVATLQQGSLMEKAGVKIGDIISSINGKNLTDLDQARHFFRGAMADGFIEIAFRGEKRVVRIDIPW